MKAVVAAFNQEKALIGAFSVITNLQMELFQALMCGVLVTPCSVQLPQPARDLAGAGPARVPGGRRLHNRQRGLLPPVHRQLQPGAVKSSSAVKRSIGFTITEKAPTRAFSWLKAPTGAPHLRHYAKQTLTPR